MRHLPSEQKERTRIAIQEFEQNGRLVICEPCDCGSHIRHNNGGNYHETITLQKDEGQVFVKYETTCELVAPAKWQVCDDWQQVIKDNADWL